MKNSTYLLSILLSLLVAYFIKLIEKDIMLQNALFISIVITANGIFIAKAIEDTKKG